MTRRLIHLNGMPGIGKSTIARRYAASHPGTLVCDIDVLRTFVGGWEADFASAGRLIRPAALGLVRAYVAESGDVVLPQLLSRLSELERFERAALDAGAAFVEVMLTGDAYAATRRVRARAGRPGSWERAVRDVGEKTLAGYRRGLGEVLGSRPATRVVTVTDGDVEATYASLRAALDL